MSRGHLLAGYVFVYMERTDMCPQLLIVLGVFLTTSDAQTADVECFSTDGNQTLLTDQMSDCQ
jgi:hypothetical protein